MGCLRALGFRFVGSFVSGDYSWGGVLVQSLGIHGALRLGGLQGSGCRLKV